MISGSLFGSETDTIMSGVVFLWIDGSWPLAVILFIASIAVPFSKLFALAYLLVSVQRRSTLAPVQRTRLYRVLEFVGRWSMIDIYVAALLTALVQFGGLMSIRAGPGAIAFGAVVVLTMFAAESFDPRLIWDPVEAPSGR
jgi:paraquat-inducible protein A